MATVIMNSTIEYANYLYASGINNDEVYDTIKNCSQSELKTTKEGVKYFIKNGDL